MKNILITGVTGFVGSHLAEYILNNHQDYKVFGTYRHRSDRENIQFLENKIFLVECEMTDSHSVSACIKEIRPYKIFHLAAQSYVPSSWNAPQETFNINIGGTLNLFEAIREIKNNYFNEHKSYDPVIQIACSSEEYGFVKMSEVPIKETNELRPLSPYGVSKVTQEMLAYQYYQSYGLKTIITRAFNHTGPRRGEIFVCSNFAKQIAEIEINKKAPIIHVGNLETYRDFTDVRDMVRAYWLATDFCNYAEPYNICSGETHKIKDILIKLLFFSTNKNIKIKEDETKLRPSDVPLLYGDNTKFVRATDWKPEIDFDQTLKDILKYWRMKVKNDNL